MFKQPNIDPVVATLGRQLEKDSFFTSDDQSMEEGNGSGRCCPGLSNLHALFVKNLLKLRRNPAMLLFVFLLPAIQVVFLVVELVFSPARHSGGFLLRVNRAGTKRSCHGAGQL